MKVFKRLLALLLILLIIGVVVVLIGAGALALFPNRHIFGFKLAYIKFANEGDKIAYDTYRVDDQYLSAFDDIVINSQSFNINVVFVEDTALKSEKEIEFKMEGNMQGFSTSPLEDLKLGYTIDEEALKQNKLVISTYEPNGWKLTNRCNLDIMFVKSNLKNLTITTNGKVNVTEGCTIEKLNVTSYSSKENNVIVKSKCGDFVMTNNNGSGTYESFDGNIEINSKSGNFTFKNINGSVIANGTQMHLTVNNITGNLEYNIDYGRGEFGTVSEDTYIKSKGTNITVTNANKGVYVTDGGNSKITINENGTQSAAITNEIVMDKGEFTLKKSYYKTDIKMNGGKINIEDMNNEVLINNADAQPTSKVKVNVTFGDAKVFTDTEKCLVAKTNGDISLDNVAGAVDIASSEKSSITLKFKNIKGVSDIYAPNSNVSLYVPNNERYNVIAQVDNLGDISFDVGGAKEGTATQANGVYTKVYEIGTGSATGREITIKTSKSLNVQTND